MKSISRKYRSVTIITWALTGLITFCLINSVPTVKSSLGSAEASVLKVEFEDDDKDDSRKLDFALVAGMDHRGSTEPWHNAPDSVPSNAVHTQLESHLVRGPPSSCC